MQYLQRIRRTPAASWYTVNGEYDGPVERFVVSTPGTRSICNQPEVLGVDFNIRLHDGMARALRSAPFRSLLEDHPENRVCVVNFLRGGLNFELRRALHTAYGFNRHSSAFMSSQRYKTDGRWHVKEDMYRKLEIPSEAVLVMGDVVATGVTVDNGLSVIADHVQEQGSSVKALVFFTIGCHKVEKVLEKLHNRLSSVYPGYERTICVYIEGKFRLVDSKSELRIGLPGTDLIRRHALLAPELERSQYGAMSYMLERCAIYDAGSRAFDIPEYASDVLEYWQQVAGFAAEGWTLAEALEERCPELFYERERFLETRRAQWRGVGDALFQTLYTRQNALRHGESVGTARALAAICDDRLNTLRDVAGEDA